MLDLKYVLRDVYLCLESACLITIKNDLVKDCGKLTISVSSSPRHRILIDYDNLAKNVGMKPDQCWPYFAYIAKALDEQSIFFDNVGAFATVDIRLYGGWFCDKDKTRLAQTLIKEINTISKYKQYTLKSKSKANLSVSLANGLASIRGHVFYGTMRKYDPNIRIDDQMDSCCNDMESMLNSLSYFLGHNNECIGCQANMEGILYSEGQKLVDTMIACDLQFFASQEDNKVAVVSSDDDLVPPLFFQTASKNNVFHVLTTRQSSFCYENYYYPTRPANYKSVFLDEGV